MPIRSVQLLLTLALLVGGNRACADWPQWLGPQRNGLSDETGLLQEWPEEGPRRVWLFKDCGLGYSGPAVVGNTLYILGSREGTEQLLALDSKSGKELWSADLGDEYENNWGNGPRGTPTVEGDRVYAIAAQGNLVCLSATDGTEHWRVSFTDMGGEIPTWGYAESPLVDGDRVLATPGGPNGAVVALDKLSGKVLWQSVSVTDMAHYSSILAGELNGQRQYLQLLPEQLVALNPNDGAMLWSVAWPGKVAVIPTPLLHENQVYVTSGYGVGCMLVKIASDNQPTVLYDNKVIKNHHGGVVRIGKHLFGHSDRGGWTCQDWATGERIWSERSALGKGSVGYADGRLYCLSEDDGEVVLVEPSLDDWHEYGRFTLAPQTEQRKPSGKIWTHPVVVNGMLYLRDQELLFAYDVRSGR